MDNKTLECHDCGEELTFEDEYLELDGKKIKYCPFCGSKNIIIND